MKKIIYFVCTILVTFFSCFSLEQDFIKKPKIKKVYPSCQQSIELEGELIACINKILYEIICFEKKMIKKQSECLSIINEYIDGDKECFLNKASKDERADRYIQNKKKKQKLESLLHVLERQFKIDEYEIVKSE